tara:strand:- start:189 stop:488 length:300 start_codon:yes stop_codon:yes gene_type:complete
MSLDFKLDVPRYENVISVKTTNKRGFTPEELAEECVGKIISVSDTAPPAIRDQARAFEKNVEKLVAHYMRRSIESDRTTVWNALTDAGHPELAELIRRL